ncbi:MAG: MotA/TolQ/ExbB proton channel family protein [Planctomycetaceae bacterium]|nr:MotA/TolQ/ExbB proton channel family protein [Planctomycetaceae bacterium]
MDFIFDWAGPIIYASLGVAALYGVFCVILLLRKIKEKRFANEAAAADFLDQMHEHLEKRDFDGAAELCDSPPFWAKAVPQLILVALANKDRPLPKLRRMLAEKFERDVLADLEYRHSWIGTIVKTAPMLGLLGTVSGMILAFAKIATSQQTGSDPKALADDISLALLTTAMGLTVAIPLVLLGALVQVRIGKLQDSVQQYVGEFLDDLESANSV